MPAIDRSRLGEILRPLGDDDAREVLGFVIEDIDIFLRRLDDIEASEGLSLNSLFHKIKGFSAQFFLPDCAEIAAGFLSAPPMASPSAVRPLTDALGRARDELLSLSAERAANGAGRS